MKGGAYNESNTDTWLTADYSGKFPEKIKDIISYPTKHGCPLCKSPAYHVNNIEDIKRYLQNEGIRIIDNLFFALLGPNNSSAFTIAQSINILSEMLDKTTKGIDPKETLENLKTILSEIPSRTTEQTKELENLRKL